MVLFCHNLSRLLGALMLVIWIAFLFIVQLNVEIYLPFFDEENYVNLQKLLWLAKSPSRNKIVPDLQNRGFNIGKILAQ